MVVNRVTNIKLADILLNLRDMCINDTIIYSINLRDDLKAEVFDIRAGDSKIIYIEIGVGYFMEILNFNPLRSYVFNKKALYILRDGFYFDIKYILSHIGENNINLGRGGHQLAHVISPLELRFTSYLMAMYNFNYKYILELNTFNALPKSRYLPFSNYPET